MNLQMWSFLGTAGLVSLVHGLLPNHWLPFVLVGRAQHWKTGTMLSVLVAAGAAHTAVAGAIALALLLAGVAIQDLIRPAAHLLPGAILGAAGVFFLVLDRLPGRHHHHDLHEAHRSGMSDATAVVTLILSLALSPCEAMIPVFLSAVPHGDPVLLLGMVVLSGAATIIAMATLALVAWRGARRLDFGRFAHLERSLIGLLLLAMGLVSLAVGLWGHAG